MRYNRTTAGTAGSINRHFGKGEEHLMTREEQFDKTLSLHTIDKVSFYRFRARYPRLHGKNARLSYHGFGGEVTVAKIFTNQGASGWGQISTNLEEAKAAARSVEGKALTDLSLIHI